MLNEEGHLLMLPNVSNCFYETYVQPSATSIIAVASGAA